MSEWFGLWKAAMNSAKELLLFGLLAYCAGMLTRIDRALGEK